MEERTTTLFKNLNMIYRAEVAILASMIILIINLVTEFMGLIAATIGVVAVFVMLIATIVSLVALVGLRNVHKDYYFAIGMPVLGVLLGLFGGIADFLFWTSSSVAKLLQNYLIIRATNSLLAELETGQEKTIRQGKLVWKLYLLNALVGLATRVVPMENNLMLMLAILLITLILGVVAAVFNVIYLKAGSEAFRDAIPPETA